METVSNRMQGILPLFDMQTGYFPNALIGISDSDAHKRLDTAANHVAWLAGSLVQQRFELAGWLNVKKQRRQMSSSKIIRASKNRRPIHHWMCIAKTGTKSLLY
jgi:hypothetical protein